MLSVAGPTYQRSQALAKTLTSSRRAVTVSPELVEILVVDNGSTDNTRAVVERFAHELPGLRNDDGSAAFIDGRHY